MPSPHLPDAKIDAVVSGRESLTINIDDGRHGPLLPPLYEDERTFEYTNYSKEIHPPVPVSHIDTSALKREYSRCLDMPIRLPGQEAYSLPVEWSGLAVLLVEILRNEHLHNPNWRDYHTYITVDQKEVSAGEQQRHGGLHVDGFQGERIAPKTKITRNYVVTTNGGTRFYPQRFTVVDPAKFNVFQGFDLQAGDPLVAEPDLVYFMNAYTVHESGIAHLPGLRTFLRVTYDLKEFDREGNTKNSALKYDWKMVARTAHQEVATPTVDDIAASPYSV